MDVTRKWTHVRVMFGNLNVWYIHLFSRTMMTDMAMLDRRAKPVLILEGTGMVMFTQDCLSLRPMIS